MPHAARDYDICSTPLPLPRFSAHMLRSKELNRKKNISHAGGIAFTW
jgi:hypothetical protein